MMETVLSLKRKAPKNTTNFSKCLFCQCTTASTLRDGTESGKYRIKDVVAQRRKLCDFKNVEVLDRLESIADWTCKFFWHKDCYSAFTSAQKIARLRKVVVSDEPSCSASTTEEPRSRPPSRSTVDKMDWSLCIFCQRNEQGLVLRNVQTLETNKKILDNVHCNIELLQRLSCTNDIVASEGKYHLRCYSSFLRDIDKCSKDQANVDNHTMVAVIQEIKMALARGDVLELDEVWNRYLEVANLIGETPKQRYLSRKSSFKEDIEKCLGDLATFVLPLDKEKSHLIFPTEHAAAAVTKLCDERTDINICSMSVSSDCEFFRSLVHVMLKIRSDLKSAPGHEGWKCIDFDHVKKVIPNSLFIMLMLLCKGESVLDYEGECPTVEASNNVYGIAQDIVYLVSGGKKLTPKHIGLGVTVHNVTRSKQLVDLLHESGHCISYDMVRRIDTTIVSSILDDFVTNGKVFVPANIVKGRFAHFSVDNIDVLEDTVDGKNTFHATQMCMWQRGPSPDIETDSVKIGQEKTIDMKALEEINAVYEVHMPVTAPAPTFHGSEIKYDTIFTDQGSHDTDSSRERDAAWLFSRSRSTNEQRVPGWTEFNSVMSSNTQPVTNAGFLPMINQPAHEYDTLYTVLIRCMNISKFLNLSHTVITVDQALYCKLKQLTWLKPKTFENVIIRLGGLHILMNFLKCIGQHMASSGLEDLWVESGVYGESTAQTILAGKSYNRGVRAHKMTYEALWRLLVEKQGPGIDADDLAKLTGIAFARSDQDMIKNTVERLEAHLRTCPNFLDIVDTENADSPTYTYWRGYMKMVEIMLDFIRAERDGNWQLHLSSFQSMLPYFFLYDHTNYARWGTIYISDMIKLEESAPDVYNEYMAGNFPVKRSDNLFNQVSADQALEWMNRACKVAGGLVGITKVDTAREKWCLAFNEKACIAEQTRQLFGMNEDEVASPTRNDTIPAGIKRDEADIRRLMDQLQRFKVFEASDDLRCISTNDIATADIHNDIHQSETRGKELLKSFVKERLESDNVAFHETLPKVKAKTLASMYEVTVTNESGQKQVVKADRNLFQRLLVAKDSGRNVNLMDILQYELSPVPLSIADTNRNLRSTAKSVLSKILTENIGIVNTLPNSELSSCVIIDGPALIQALGKPSNAKTFGDLAEVFCENVFKHFSNTCNRVDVVFDRYFESSIKNATRIKRSGKVRPIRRIIDSKEVPLPQVWKHFIDLSENKAQLASFLSQQLMEKAKSLPENCELVTAGGFESINTASSSTRASVEYLQADHEEADTRLVLHSKEAHGQGYGRTVVICADTDVLVLLIHFRGLLSKEVWMKQGKKFIPIHEIDLDESVREHILGFHAVSGCDTTSSFYGHGKKKAWQTYLGNPGLLSGIGHDGLTEEKYQNVEEFVCRLYDVNEDTFSVNEARHILFCKSKSPSEGLPPTQNALRFHVKRVQYQASIWLKSSNNRQNNKSPVDSGGWVIENDRLAPVLMDTDPVPKKCLEIISCGCKTKCATANCKCYKNNLQCIKACKCEKVQCKNPR